MVEFGQLSKEDLPALSAYVSRQRLPQGTGDDDRTGDDEDTGLEGTGGESAPGSGSGDASSGDDEASDEAQFVTHCPSAQMARIKEPGDVSRCALQQQVLVKGRQDVAFWGRAGFGLCTGRFNQQR